MGVDKSTSNGVYDVIMNGASTESVIVSTPYGDVLPSSKALAGAGVELISMDDRQFLLKAALRQVADKYDFIFIDCPPSLELLTLNALCAANSLLVPVQGEYYALEGLSDLMNTVRIVRRSMNPGLEIEGVLLTMYDGRTNLSIQVAQELKRFFAGKVYSVVIPERAPQRSAQPRQAHRRLRPDMPGRGSVHGAGGGISAEKQLLKGRRSMANTKGLGKGLSALLGDDVIAAKDERASSLLLPISQVESCSTQPRKSFDPEALSDLADSIRVHGIIQPLTVRKLQSGYYQIIAYERRRWRAARMAGLTQVPAVVIEADDRKAMELAMIENLQRE